MNNDNLLRRIRHPFYYQRALGYHREIKRLREEIREYESVHGKIEENYNLKCLKMTPEEKEANRARLNMWAKKYLKIPNLEFNIGHEYIMQPPSQESMQRETKV